MPYQLLKVEKETAVGSDGGSETVYVALVKKEGEDQPFRMVLDHFETKDEALAQVNRWIAQQDEEEKSGVIEREESRKTEAKDSIMDQINAQ